MINAMQKLLEIPKRQYERCWNKCIQAEGRRYFEGGLIHYQDKFSIVSLTASVQILFDQASQVNIQTPSQLRLIIPDVTCIPNKTH